MALSSSTNKDGSKSFSCRIPKIIVEELNNPKSLRFKLGKNRIYVEAGYR